MAYSLTDTGVSVTSGKGRNAVALVVSFKEIEAWAKRMRKDTKELWRLSYGRAVAGLKKKFVQIVLSGGGLNGVPKFKDFEDFTKTLRAKRGTSAPMGGILADVRSKGVAVAYKRNGAQVIGWGDHLHEAAISFQEGRGGPNAEKWFTDPNYRRSWHRQGIQDIPHAYAHNPRMVLMPYFADYIKSYLDEWARSAYYTGLVKLMRGGKDAAFSRANLA